MVRAKSPSHPYCWSSGLALAAATFLLALPAAARAQSVDYQQLEQLFGEPVTTSVTGKPQRASDAPAALTIITREDIRRSPAKDIVGLLQAYAGVDVARWTAGQSDVSIRGGVQPYNPRLLVLVNGQQVYLDHHGMTNWSSLGVQMADIQQIEIVRGPNSALFGFNAVSGVINIITVNPLQTQQVTMTAEAGDHGYADLSASAAVKLGRQFGLRLSGGYGGAKELDGLATSALAPFFRTTYPSSAEAAAELYGRFGEQTEAVLSASHSQSRQTDFIHLLLSSKVDQTFSSLGARVSHDAGWGVLSGRVYQNTVDIRIPLAVGGVASGTYREFHNEVLVASTAALVRLGGSNTARIGFEYRDNRLVSRPGYEGATRYNIYSVDGMWESAVTDFVTLTLAGRLDQLKLQQEGVIDQPSLFTKQDFDRTINAWSLNSAVLFKLDSSSTLRVVVARGLQAPSLSALGSRQQTSLASAPVLAVNSGDPLLEPTIIWSGEVGFTRSLGGGGRLELTAFYNRLQDIISQPALSTTPRFAPPAYSLIVRTPKNVGSFEAYGLEASLAGRLGTAVSWSANYSWTRASQDIQGETGDKFEWPIALDRTTPEHKLKAQVSYERGAWLGTVAARYTSKTQQLIFLNGQIRPFDIDDTVALDAKAAFRFSPRVTLEVAGENLTDQAGVNLSPAAAERRLRAGVRVNF